ncbi:MAG: hypothetical protein AB1489_18135, partial [Acidobacteriota bacterium]
KWQNIRPIGTIRGEQQFIVEKRKKIAVDPEKFNENVYKNATYTVLSANKRYVFNDPHMSEQIEQCQTKVHNIITDFVDLVKDKQLKKEILLANESDRYNSYENKEPFKIETYLTQLADLSIALFNDDFLYQSVRIFELIRQLSVEYSVNLVDLAQFQNKGMLLNTQKIEEYAGTELERLLIKQIIRLFSCWHPQWLLSHMQVEDNRRVRRALLKVIECYGKEIYGLLVTELSTNARQLPWYYARNLISLLGRVTCDNEQMKNEVVELLNGYWQRGTQRQLVYQIISTLGFIGTERACERLVARLRQYESQKDRASLDLCQKILLALLDTELDSALEAVIEFYQKNNQLGQLIDKFNKIYLSDRIIQLIAGKIQKETQRLKYSFSLLGDTETAIELLRLVAHMGNEPVKALCQEIIKVLPHKHPLVAEAEQILTSIPMSCYCAERTLQKLAIVKNLPKMLCQIAEAGISGRLMVRTVQGIEARLDFERGEILRAEIPALNIEQAEAFYWTFLLEPREVESLYCNIAVRPAQSEFHSTYPIETLICEGLLERGEMLQIGKYISPEACYGQRPVTSYYTDFEKYSSRPAQYQAVWNALANNVDVAALEKLTHLPKHTIYKILFHFLKQNMLIIDGRQQQQKELNIEEGLAMLEINLQRIQRSPVVFGYYKTSAEICADLMRESSDDVFCFTFDVLRKCFLRHHQEHVVLAPKNFDSCFRVIALAENYLKGRGPQERDSLLNCVRLSFEEDYIQAPSEAEDETAIPVTVLEKIENIDQANDPLDPVVNNIDQATVDEVWYSLETDLKNIDAGADFTAGRAIVTAEDRIREMFDNIAISSVKPFKDFIRELYHNWKAGRATSLKWIELIEPVITLLSSSAAKMGYQQIAEVMIGLQQTIKQQKQLAKTAGHTTFGEEIAQQISVSYLKLCELQPKTFALVMTDEDLAQRKEILLVKLILKQLPEVTERVVNKFLFLGLNTFDKFMDARPDKIAAQIDISKDLAEQICMKFYQYRNIYYQDGDPDYQQKFFAMFELNLRMLKELHADVEAFVLAEQTGDLSVQERKESLRLERQRTLWSLFILLCIREEYNLVELIQQSVFDVRIQLFDDYLSKLAAMPMACQV